MYSVNGIHCPFTYLICNSNINTLKIEPADLLRCIIAVTFKPSSHSFRKSSNSYVHCIVTRNIVFNDDMFIKHKIEIFFKVAQKNFTALSGEQTLYTLLLLL